MATVAARELWWRARPPPRERTVLPLARVTAAAGARSSARSTAASPIDPARRSAAPRRRGSRACSGAHPAICAPRTAHRRRPTAHPSGSRERIESADGEARSRRRPIGCWRSSRRRARSAARPPRAAEPIGSSATSTLLAEAVAVDRQLVARVLSGPRGRTCARRGARRSSERPSLDRLTPAGARRRAARAATLGARILPRCRPTSPSSTTPAESAAGRATSRGAAAPHGRRYRGVATVPLWGHVVVAQAVGERSPRGAPTTSRIATERRPERTAAPAAAHA